MKTISNFPARWLSILAIFILIAVQIGCDSSGSLGGLPDTSTYRVEGVLVNDPNADPVAGDTARIVVRFERSDSLLSSASVTFGATQLQFDRPSFLFDSVYSFALGPTSLVETGSYGLGLVDSTRFGDTLAMIVPDTFWISFYTGDSTVPNTNGQEIQISWTASASATGYVVAVVLEHSTYTGYGYSQYVTAQTTQTTIPLDAFRLSTGGAELDTGWYAIYVYSYAGLPDSSLTAPLLPVPLPSSFGDNVDLQNITGRLGTVSVTRRVRSHVVSQ